MNLPTLDALFGNSDFWIGVIAAIVLAFGLFLFRIKHMKLIALVLIIVSLFVAIFLLFKFFLWSDIF